MRAAASIGLALLLVSLAAPAEAPAPGATARELMLRVEQRDDGDRGSRKMEMVLVDRDERTRRRRIQAYTRDAGVDTYRLMFFLDPPDVRSTGLLTYDYDAAERDDDQWLYLPGLRKTKRIASSDKSGSFMGSDFSFADLTERKTERYEFSLMKQLEFEGNPVWQIQAIPNADERDETGYTKSVLIVRPDIDFVVRAIHWKQNGEQKYMDVRRLEQVDGIWVATEVSMTTKRAGQMQQQTTLRSWDVHFGLDMDDDLFTTRRLEKGL